ncbi:MAG: hypothetical protein H0T66_19705 [Geodermatophilaceae bacterium]|nr:hypothetical protein [Geodermatophilaceae bacterium]
MLAVAGALPPAADDHRWGFEFKWDGVRALCLIDRGAVHLISRNDRDITPSYPEIAPLGAAVAGPSVLDGELVAFDDNGRPSFGVLQHRMHVTAQRAVQLLVRQVPVTYFVFDALVLSGVDLTGEPYHVRRARLEELGLQGPAWQCPPYFRSGGAEIQAASRASGLEGVVAKRLDSTYRSGQRSEAWRKIKNVQTRDIVIGGWKPGQGGRSGRLGSLMMGLPAAGGLRYVGNVGSGFSDRTLTDLDARLAALATTESPFADVPRELLRDARWVRPELVGEVAYGEWTGDRRLRHPTWRGLRPDIGPGEVDGA